MITSTTLALLVSGTIEVQTLSFSSVAVTNAPSIEMLEPTDDDDEDTGCGGDSGDGDSNDGNGDDVSGSCAPASKPSVRGSGDGESSDGDGNDGNGDDIAGPSVAKPTDDDPNVITDDDAEDTGDGDGKGDDGDTNDGKGDNN